MQLCIVLWYESISATWQLLVENVRFRLPAQPIESRERQVLGLTRTFT